MENGKSSGGGFVAASVFFVLTAIVAICMLLTAGFIWLSAYLGSFIYSALLIGGLFTLVALAIYLFSLRKAIARIREQLDTVYYVSRLAKDGYDWLNKRIFSCFRRLFSL